MKEDKSHMNLEEQIKIDNVSVGDTFSTENKLVRTLGLETKRGKAKNLQLNEIKRYLEYEKTGKINKKTKKVSNEIMITKIYKVPLIKETGDYGEYKEALTPRIKNLVSGVYTYNMLYVRLGIISDEDKEMIKGRLVKRNAISTYINIFKQKCNRDIDYALSHTDGVDVEHTYYVSIDEDAEFFDCKLATREEKQKIDDIKKEKKKEFEKKHNKSFNSIKWDKVIYEEYIDALNDEFEIALGYKKVYAVLKIDTIIEEDDDRAYEWTDGVSRANEVYARYMRKQIKEYHYPLNRGNGFNSKKRSHLDVVYPLRDSPKVYRFHDELFGDDYYEDELEDEATTIPEPKNIYYFDDEDPFADSDDRKEGIA